MGRAIPSGFPFFGVGNGARIAGFRDWLGVVAAQARGEYHSAPAPENAMAGV